MIGGFFFICGMRGSPDFVIRLLQNCLQIFVVSILTTGGDMAIVGERGIIETTEKSIDFTRVVAG